MKITVFWSCAGVDGSALSFHTAALLAETDHTLIVELPCLGIPRMGFVCGISDKSRNTEAAISYFEQYEKIPWEMLHPIGKRLYALPANVYAVPDFPVVSKVSVDTLMAFIGGLVDVSQSRGISHLVLECQGQLNSPMTFFALKKARKVVIPIGKPSEAAYALASVRRLVSVYKLSADAFILATDGNLKMIQNATSAIYEDEEALEGLSVISWDSRKIKGVVDRDGSQTANQNNRRIWLPGLKPHSGSDPAATTGSELTVTL